MDIIYPEIYIDSISLQYNSISIKDMKQTVIYINDDPFKVVDVCPSVCITQASETLPLTLPRN